MEAYALAGIPVLALILGLVEFAKKFGISGNVSVGLAMVLGVMFGALVYANEQGLMPPEIMVWVNVVVFGLAFGLAAAGMYDLGKRFLIRG
jgi:hypothetical protein